MAARVVAIVASVTASTLAAAAGPNPEASSETHVELEWTAPAACPSRQAVLEQVKRTLGSARAVSEATVVRVEVTREAAGYVGTLRMTSGGAVHERRLEADDCAAVSSAAALIMALAVEGILPPPTPLPTPPPAPRTPPGRPAVPSTPPAPVEPEAPRAAAEPWRSRLVVSAAALVDTATLPALAVGPDVGVGWSGAHRALRLGVSAQGAFFPSRFGGVGGDASGTGGRFELLEGALRGCAGYAWRSITVGPCLGVGVDHLSGSGRGSSVSLTGAGTWASGQGAALATWSLSRWLAVEGLLGAAVPFARPTFVLDSLATSTSPASSSAVHRPAPVSARCGIGLELRFF